MSKTAYNISLKGYVGGLDFDRFDHSHMGEGEGAQAYGWGTYVTEVEGIGKVYATQKRGRISYKGHSIGEIHS